MVLFWLYEWFFVLHHCFITVRYCTVSQVCIVIFGPLRMLQGQGSGSALIIIEGIINQPSSSTTIGHRLRAFAETSEINLFLFFSLPHTHVVLHPGHALYQTLSIITVCAFPSKWYRPFRAVAESYPRYEVIRVSANASREQGYAQQLRKYLCRPYHMPYYPWACLRWQPDVSKDWQKSK